MGLKGNLDMCLAARLSTQANLGHMSSGREIFRMVYGNIAVVQVQATVAAFLVGWFAIGAGAIMDDEGFIFPNAMLLLASSLFTATVSCFVLGNFSEICWVSATFWMSI
jgi:solute carrier family 41